ncbi:NAD(P)H-dependent oxidoreductase [Arenibacter sp. S6351L]|uniref:NAD(P)H-dependent oxidoreductase n=1 Tax=Arenibacter sp. S6351L TaxID=2926407 RepID=UPI001FF190AB|nr:NAD(P)H-dependent oxidoreductase [Arenibacter sp. S6351L]MCK0136141.1 NAD(P)H-dependent oxidoreductase [Arenibacter sp. S6351L]
MNLIDHLNWRYATKMFDPKRKVGKQDLEFLKEAIRLSVSSYGLQLYKVLIIENDEIRAALRKASWDQSQITDASQLFVFCNYTLDYDRHVDDYVERIITTQGNSSDGIKQYGESIKSIIAKMSAEERKSWSEKQTYLALNNLLIACAELKIDACPMEGFDNQAYNQILGLDELGLNAAVIAPVGYRSASDKSQNRLKIRKTKEELFQTA